MAEDFAREFFWKKGFEVLFAVHVDTEHVHVHFSGKITVIRRMVLPFGEVRRSWWKCRNILENSAGAGA